MSPFRRATALATLLAVLATAGCAGSAGTAPETGHPADTAAAGSPATTTSAPATTASTPAVATDPAASGVVAPTAPPPAVVAAPSSAPFRFLAWGDTKVDTGTSAGDVLQALSADAQRLNPAPSFTVYLGDLEETGFSRTAGLADQWLAHLNGGTGNGTSDVTFVARGNHDAMDATSTANWQAYFDFTTVARKVGAANYTELEPGITYSFDFNNAHFVCLDAPGDFPKTVTQRQLTWLDQDLAAAEGRGLTHAFLYWHGPIYSVGSSNRLDNNNPEPAIQQLIAIAGRHPIVSALLNGHEHLLAYKHIGPSTFPTLTVAHEFEQFTIGTGGASFHTPVPGRGDAVLPYVPAYATVDVNGRSFTVTWYGQGSAAPQGTFSFTK